MHSRFLACIVSGGLGLVIGAGWLAGRGPIEPARAAEPPQPPAAATPALAQAPLPPRPDGAAPPGRAVAQPLDAELAELTPEERVNVLVYEKCNRAVVNINTRGERLDTFFLIEVPSEGSGSGTIIDKQGHILTNNHVIQDAREIQVTLFNGQTYPAAVVGADPANDLAVIRIPAPPEVLFPVPLGDSTRLRVGERVFAIGNPFGLERTLTTGVISSLNRSLPVSRARTLKSIIQIDAAINPGNSGGPLLDTRGRLIGVNTAIASRTGQSSGVGFAIGAATIHRIVPQLIQRGRVIRPDIGIARVFETERGLLVAQLVPDGPAHRAGLRGPAVVRKRRGPFVFESVDVSAADLIIAVDGQRVATADEFLTIIETKRPGDEVRVTVVREGQQIDIPVELASDE